MALKKCTSFPGITANFINNNSDEEAKIDEISGVASLFNQKFFADLKTETDIDLENIVYYKVMTTIGWFRNANIIPLIKCFTHFVIPYGLYDTFL